MIFPFSVQRALRLGALFSALVLAASTLAQEKEPTLVEAKAAFEKADKAMNAAWSAAKAAVPEQALGRLTLGQREWLEHRDWRATQESKLADQKNARQSPVYFSTAAALMEDRADWLRARAKPAEDSLSGLWRDSYGGTLRIVQDEARLFFIFEVVRGPTSHTGGLAGVGAWNTKLGWFSDKGRDADKTDETNIAFVERDGELEVIGANTGYYHGARAYFDGSYCKVAPLDDDEQKVVSKAAKSGEVPEE